MKLSRPEPADQTAARWKSTGGRARLMIDRSPHLIYHDPPHYHFIFIPLPIGAQPVTLAIYDLMGCKNATLINAMMSAGHQKVQGNGESANGQTVASGLYFARLKTSVHTRTKPPDNRPVRPSEVSLSLLTIQLNSGKCSQCS